MDDGGPAFPVECAWVDGKLHDGVQTGNSTRWATGLSVRDYFAAKAMQGVLADSEFMAHSVAGTTNETQWRANCAASFYAWADAMLAARNTK